MLKLRLAGFRCPLHAPRGGHEICCGISHPVWLPVEQEQPRVQRANVETMRRFLRARRANGRAQ